MGKRRTHPLPGNRKFHAPKAKRILQEAPGAAGSAMPIPAQSDGPDGDPAGMHPQESKNNGGKVDSEGIRVEGHGAGSSQEGRDRGIGGGRAPGSPEQGISDRMGENHLELPQLEILDVDGTGEDELASPKPGILEVDGAGEEPPESVKHVILDGMGQNHLESSQLGILEGDGAGEEQLESPQLRIPEADGAGEEQLESLKLGILDGAGEEQLESPQLRIPEADGAEEQLESLKLGILDGAGEEQLESPQLRIPEADGAGEEQLESLKLGILDGTGDNQLESPKLGISEVAGTEEKQLETPTHRILDGAGEEHAESVKPGISEADGAREEQLEPLKQGIWDGAGENQLESPKQGNSGAQGSSPENTVRDMAPAESSEVPDAAGEEEEGALEEGCDTGIALSMDMGSLDCPRDPQRAGGDMESRNCESGNAEGGNSSLVTPGLDPAATSTEPQDHREGTSPELPMEKPFLDAAGQQPWDTTGRIHTGSTGNSPVQPWESSARATEPADASDVIRGLIRELSDLNRLAMGARRGLELLRRPKPRRGRRPVPSGSRWKEG